MKKRYFIIVLLALAVFTWLFSWLLDYQRRINEQITALQNEVVSIRKHDVVQDRLIGEAVMYVHKPSEVPQQVVKTPEVELPPVTPIPFYIGAVEAIKRFIFR